MDDTVFELDSACKRASPMPSRAKATGFDRRAAGPAPPEFYGMGHALYSTPRDYARFLRMVLNGGTLDGARILSPPESVRAMLAARTGDLVVTRMRLHRAARLARLRSLPRPYHHPFDGLVPAGRRRARPPPRRLAVLGGRAQHALLARPRRPGIAGLFMTQLAPWADAGLMKAYEAYERGVYAGLG
jgi:methyl acetate hydrolase